MDKQEGRMSPEEIKERAREVLLNGGVEKIEEKDGVYYFHFTKPLQKSWGGLQIHDEEKNISISPIGAYVGAVLDPVSADVVFRCVRGGTHFDRLPTVMSNGVDIPDFSKDSKVDLAITLGHATEFGGEDDRDKTVGSDMESNRIVMVFDRTKTKPVTGGEGHKHVFKISGRDALKGIILLYSQEERKNGLIEINSEEKAKN